MTRQSWAYKQELFKAGLKICTGLLCQGKIKPHDEFHKNKKKWDGVVSRCKECVRHYQQSDVGIKSRLKNSHSEKRRDYMKKYYHSEQKRDWRKGYYRSKKYRTHRRRGRKKNKEQIKARSMLNAAIRYNGFPRIHTCACELCGKQAEHYHHESYKPEHWLDVMPLCVECHNRIHSIKA